MSICHCNIKRQKTIVIHIILTIKINFLFGINESTLQSNQSTAYYPFIT